MKFIFKKCKNNLWAHNMLILKHAKSVLAQKINYNTDIPN